MAQFYKELKELRESRKISLEEISERTKINIQYLQAIESGDFSDMETPYLRLFLRAYAEEIGGDSQRSLEQLDSYTGTSRPPVISVPAFEDEPDDKDELETKSKVFLTDQTRRQDYIKGGFISIIFIFSIIIFQKIFNEESRATGTESGPVLQKMIRPLTSQDLLKDYILDQSSDELLIATPPFFVKLKTLEQTAYTFKNDTLPPVSNILNANWEQDLGAFVKSSELVFTTTKGLALYINAIEIKHLSGYEHPLRLIIKPSPPSMAIQRYKPLP